MPTEAKACVSCFEKTDNIRKSLPHSVCNRNYKNSMLYGKKTAK
jgi:hypothetical protein